MRHSLGDFIASRYMLKHPKVIKKVLLLSPAGITDYSIPGTNILAEIGCCNYFIVIFFSSLVYSYQLRVQNLYRCCCFHNFINKPFGTYECELDEYEIKKIKMEQNLC